MQGDSVLLSARIPTDIDGFVLCDLDMFAILIVNDS